jgi:Protein of unknown function (DUF3567)
MHMLYNSDNFVVVRFDLDAEGSQPAPEGKPGQARGGFEIVDKFARKEIFLEGLLADTFQQGVQALVEQGPTEEAMDEYIGRFTLLAQQPVVLH